MNTGDHVDLSIVSTLYFSSEFIDEFTTRCIETAKKVGGTYEIVLVDDGSPDDSMKRAMKFIDAGHPVRIAELARNFGHHSAILAGLSLARGRRVFYVDSDLEEDPELMLQFAKLMDETGADVVFGTHKQEVGGVFRRLSSSLFWKSFNLLSEAATEPNICNVRLMSRTYVDALLDLNERSVFLGGLFGWVGFKQVPALVHRKLKRGISTYGVAKRFALAVRSIVSFSARPLHLIFWMGAFIATMSSIVGLYFLILKLLWPSTILSGFTTLVISLWFLSGLIMASLGVIGIYLAFVYTEVKGRPRTIIRHVHELGGARK